MAVGAGTLPDIYPVKGLRLGTASAGIKYPNKRDLVVFDCGEAASVAGVFTQNDFCAAPVRIAKKNLQEKPRYLLVNTGYANAGTGTQGFEDALQCCAAVAGLAGVNTDQVLPFSTGVIGEPLPVDRIVSGLPLCFESMTTDGDAWVAAAEGIMTTDTRPKLASVQCVLPSGASVSITGMSKGAGMIQPNMATMLSFVATDANISQDLLQLLLAQAVEQSFNRITVDSDTSTNDSAMLVATCANNDVVLDEASSDLPAFVEALNSLYLELALAIVKDAEGATKLMKVDVMNASTTEEALKVAYTVAHSPLVKTALFAADPNWGRILAAVGRSGVENLNVDAIRMHLGDVLLVENGGVAPQYKEADGAAVMAQDEVHVLIDLARGDIRDAVWTCDFSYDYVKINAEYRS